GLGLVAVVLVLTLAVATLGRAVSGRGAAQVAADLAALAAARALHAPDGSRADPCDLASEVAAGHGGRLEACTPGAADVTVVVARDVGLGLVARATSRAGPAHRSQTARAPGRSPPGPATRRAAAAQAVPGPRSR